MQPNQRKIRNLTVPITYEFIMICNIRREKSFPIIKVLQLHQIWLWGFVVLTSQSQISSIDIEHRLFHSSRQPINVALKMSGDKIRLKWDIFVILLSLIEQIHTQRKFHIFRGIINSQCWGFFQGISRLISL